MTYELAQAVGMLAEIISADPMMALANSIAWLDPLWDQDEDDEFDGDDLGYAFHLLRVCLPDIYIEALEAVHNGADAEGVERCICNAVTRYGIEIDSVEEMRFGVPMHPVGINLDDSETYEIRPDLLPIVEMFGYDPKEDGPEVPGWGYAAAYVITEKLHDQPNSDWKNVGLLLEWLFACSDNDLIDNDLEGYEEMGLQYWWDEADIRRAIEAHDEVDVYMDAARSALSWLDQHPQMMAVLATNTQLMHDFIDAHKGKEKIDGDRINLEWATPDASVRGEALPNAELLQLRSDAA